jgi:hypothetical protein
MKKGKGRKGDNDFILSSGKKVLQHIKASLGNSSGA